MQMPNKVKERAGRWFYCFSIILCLICAAGTNAFAKEYPERAIRIIVQTAPGGVADLWARAWSDDFSKLLKVPVMINNQGGASAMNALIEAKSAAPDGYTLNVMSSSMAVGFAIASKPPVDLFKDFVTIGGFGYFPQLVAVEKSSPFATYEDLTNYAKKNPGKLKCGSAGVTMISSFSFELLKQQTKLDIVMVPFKAAPQATTALLGKHVDLVALPPQSLLGFIKSGRVRILLSTQRLKDYPGIPLFAEKGLVEAGINAWLGLAAPSGIPGEAVKKLAYAFEKVAKDPKIMERIETLNFTPEYQNQTEFLATMKKDYEKIVKVAKQAGISE